MFDWFWSFLYGISKSLFRLIDGLMGCANMLCGIDPIVVDDKEEDLIRFLLKNERITLAFKTACLVGIILIGVFATVSILKGIISDKNSATPAQVFVKAFKTIFMFMFVPFCMYVFIYFSSAVMDAMYKATLGASNGGIGRFLCGAFSQDALKAGTPPDFYTYESFDYTSTSQVWDKVDLSDFDFMFSWISGICILIALGQSLLMFIDRAISIVILFIVSPISLSTTMVDDGAHFKLWRDQVLVKFLTGYGCILGLNVYILIISIISSNAVEFFASPFFNNLMKIAFILGGAVSLQRVMALIGNLVQAGAGSNELRDNAIANSGFKRALGGFGKAVTSPYRAVRGIANTAKDIKQYGLGAKVGELTGFKTERDYGGRSATQKADAKEQIEMKAEANRKTNQEFAQQIGASVANAIAGGKSGDDGGGVKSDNAANQKNVKSIQIMNNAINASLSGKSDKKDEKK